MKKYDNLKNFYSLNKTLRFSLIPIGKTEENFKKNGMLEQDKHRAESYQCVKEYIDDYHREFIDSVLRVNCARFVGVREYAELYYKRDKTDAEKKKMLDMQKDMRKQIAGFFKSDKRYGKLNKKEMIEELLPSFIKDDEKLNLIKEFFGFTTYFDGFYKNRENMYSDKDISTAISYRCVNENLSIFLDNVRVFEKIFEQLPHEDIAQIEQNFEGLCGVSVPEMFSIDYFPFVLAQSGIERYNNVIGGYTTSDSYKVKGINEYVNPYNQIAEKIDRLPKLKKLYKQMLSKEETISYVPEKFEDADDLLEKIKEFFTLKDEKGNDFFCTLERIGEMFSEFGSYSENGVYISSGTSITNISNAVFGNWSIVEDGWKSEYDSINMKKQPKDWEKYEDKRKSAYKAVKSFSIADIKRYGEAACASAEGKENKDICEYFKKSVLEAIDSITTAYKKAEKLISEKYVSDKKLFNNDTAVELIKNLLDGVKALESIMKPFNGSGDEDNKDGVFYGNFSEYYKKVCDIDRLYDKVRNYVTQKPYSQKKIKLNFENPQFLNGWDRNKEREYGCFLLKKNSDYYLVIINKKVCPTKGISYDEPKSEDDIAIKMEYRQVANPAKDLPNLMVIDEETVRKTGRKEKDGIYAGQNVLLENLRDTYLPERINAIRKKKSYIVGNESFSKEDLSEYISYYIERTKEYFCDFSFSFKEPQEYNSYNDFLKNVDGQGYQIAFKKVSFSHILRCVENGELYLFRIYSKDFSEFSKGTPNLHTMYFKMLFDERNLKDVVYQLNGGAEMFYREESIESAEKITHPANLPIKKKSRENEGEVSVFGYELVKDKRYTQRQFMLHLPITLNFKAAGIKNINEYVINALRENTEEEYIVGIDRGERNLLYVCVINSEGKIKEQFSLNDIVNEYNGKKYTVDYHELLDKKEGKRTNERREWKTIENIKELKAGYLSQVVHKICELAMKYDAVIAMEDLNSGFKKGRIKVEKQVYQNFEKALIDKLNYLVDKNLSPEQGGGILNAYQLTNKFESFKEMTKQNGIIFYIPAWLTSKIDPVTGFVNLFDCRYRSSGESREFFSKFDSIVYNEEEDLFEFSFNYDNFPRCNSDSRKKWTVCTNGNRIRVFGNQDKNNEFDYRSVVLTEEFKAFFEKYGIALCDDIKKAICTRTEKAFFEELTKLFALTLQMRNSVSGDVDIDYIISPVKDKNGVFYDSRDYENIENPLLPKNADANGAYNIARKALWVINRIKNTSGDNHIKPNTFMTNAQWLEYAQNEK